MSLLDKKLGTFLKKIFKLIKAFLTTREVTFWGNHSSLAAWTLTALEQKKPITATAENFSKSLSEYYLSLSKEDNLSSDPNEDLLMDDVLKQFPKTSIGQVFNFVLKIKLFKSKKKVYSYYKNEFVNT